MSVMTRAARDTDAPEPLTPAKRKRRGIRLVATAILVVVLAGFAVSWTHAPWRNFVHRKPASYVELSVVQPARLPSTVPSGGTVRFTFVIKNVEPASAHRTVSWVTSVRDTITGATTTAGTGSADIPGGGTRTVEQQVTIKGTHRSEVIVKLASGQQIDFYVVPSSP
jgi:hypothetical protein